MALILEVVAGRDDVRHRVRLDALPLTIGRGYANDLILDDPYVDARHAQIVLDENGDCYLEDAGSLNGVTRGDQVRVTRIELVSGSTVRIGRTTLRVRDTSDGVAPAMQETRPAAGRFAAPALGKRGLAAVIAGASVVFTVMTWLGGYGRQGIGDQLTTAFMFLVMAVLWGGCWALASRVTRHRFHMLEHMAVFSVVVMLMMIAGVLASLMVFYAPAFWVSETVGTINVLFTLGLLLTAHLAFTMQSSLQRRAAIAFSISAVLVALGTTIAYATTDEYSDVPSFVSTLAPVSATVIPVNEPDALERMAAELKPDVDALKSKE